MSAAFAARTLLLGLVSWLAPFFFSMVFFDRTGQLAIPQPLFKSIMVVVFGGLGAYLLALALRRVPPSARAGLAIGTAWLAINLVLDLAVLVLAFRMPLQDYVFDIGLRYLLMPILGACMGLAAQRAAADKQHA